MWNITGKTVEIDRFQPVEPVEVLYEFDGPRIFTIKDSEAELNLAYWSDEDENGCRFVVVPTTLRILESLKKGQVSVFDAFNQPPMLGCVMSLMKASIGMSASGFRSGSKRFAARHRHNAAADFRAVANTAGRGRRDYSRPDPR